MTQDFIFKLVRISRYIACMPLIIIVGFLTMPLTLIFKWNGFYILCISCYEWCSFSEAKRLFLENKDGQYNIQWVENSYSFSDDQIDIFNNSAGVSSYSDQLRDELYSPCYAHYVSNIYHNTNN